MTELKRVPVASLLDFEPFEKSLYRLSSLSAASSRLRSAVYFHHGFFGSPVMYRPVRKWVLVQRQGRQGSCLDLCVQLLRKSEDQRILAVAGHQPPTRFTL
jgi:hypothetical protein